MSYDKAERIRYELAGGVVVQFGAAGETVGYTYKGPKGKRGYVRDIEVRVTEDMVGTTAVPEVVVGSALSTCDGSTSVLYKEYARFRLGTTAILGYLTTTAIRRALALCNLAAPPRLSDFTEHVRLETAYIPADTIFYVTLVEGIGGSETGAGMVAVEIDWF